MAKPDIADSGDAPRGTRVLTRIISNFRVRSRLRYFTLFHALLLFLGYAEPAITSETTRYHARRHFTFTLDHNGFFRSLFGPNDLSLLVTLHLDQGLVTRYYGTR